MTEYLVICVVSLIGSGLTLFSGFGLGTLLVPVFGLFFPIDVAIALTAIVHFLNNIFKLLLFGKSANRQVILKFGVPSILAAFIGATILTYVNTLAPLYDYSFFGKTILVTPVKLIIASLIFLFVLFDSLPSLNSVGFDKKYLPIGGLLSGFFGGLSGNQGALRSAFLIRLNLSKEPFIATGVVIACLIDITRLTVYSQQFTNISAKLNYTLLLAATLSAFFGVYLGNKLLKKVTIKTVQQLVATFLIIFSILLGCGLI